MSNEIKSRPSVKDPIISGLKLNLIYANDGHLVPSLEEIQITKLELSQKFGFELRDLRALHNNNKSLPSSTSTTSTTSTTMTTSSKYASPTFFVRQHAFLAHLTDITALISADKCYLFNIIMDNTPNMDDINEFDTGYDSDSDQASIPLDKPFNILNKFKAKLQSTLIFNTLPFEFHCLEGVCKAVVSKHRNNLSILEKSTNEILHNREENGEGDDNISAVKLQLIQGITMTKSCVDALNELLNNSEDLDLMYLTNKKMSDNKQLELLLENYLWQFDEILDRLQLLLDEITMFERSRGFLINKQRNEIIRMNLKLSVLTCCFSCGALCTGIFGMNLLSTLETHPYAFWIGAAGFGAMVPMTVWRHFKIHLKHKNITI